MSLVSPATASELVRSILLPNTFVRSGVTVTNGDNTFTATATDALGRSASTSVSVNLPGTAAFQYDLNGNLLSDGLRTFDYDDDHDWRSDGQERGN